MTLAVIAFFLYGLNKHANSEEKPLGRVWVQTPQHCRMVIERWSYTVDPSSDGSTVTWSGHCLFGFATGQGVLEVVGPAGTYHFEGGMALGFKKGHGTISLPTGNTLTGDFLMGDIDPSHVTYTYPDGTRYEGGWVNGTQNGQGTAVYPTGGRYEGEWRDGHPTGQGVLHTKGLIYTGEVKDGVPNGQGTLADLKGTRLTRRWNGWLHNNGPVIETSPAGDRYEGNAEDFLRVGFGVLTRADGSVYRGQWGDNRPDGTGVLVLADGTRYDGIWHKGCFQDGTRRATLFPSSAGCP